MPRSEKCPRCEQPLPRHTAGQAAACLRGVAAAIREAKLDPAILIRAEGEVDSVPIRGVSAGENLAHVHGSFCEEYDRWNYAADRIAALSALTRMRQLMPDLVDALTRLAKEA